MKKIINFIKNFVSVFLLTLITMFFYAKTTTTVFMFFVMFLYSLGLELYQWIYAKAKFNPYDVVIRMAAFAAAWQICFAILKK